MQGARCEWAEIRSCFNRKYLLQAFHFLAVCKLSKAFAAVAVLQIDLQHSLKRARQISGFDSGENLSAHGLIFPKATADEYVVAIEAFATDFDPGAEAAYITHIMLRAGIRAAGQ